MVEIQRKVRRVLSVIFLCFLTILLRVWFLSVVQKDHFIEEAHRPQRRVVIEPADRGIIRDRFGLPLATNHIQYNLAISYAHIREQIPSTVWKKDEDGKPFKVQARLSYIADLASFIGAELGLDPSALEDAIHGKASLFPHTPFVLRENLTEEEYYRLRLLEKDWVGLQTQKTSKRFYPYGKVGCDVIGYLGAISSNKYQALAQEIRELKDYLAKREAGENLFLPLGFNDPMQVRERLSELEEQAYTINDLVGKSGVEAFYEEELRGKFGKKIYEVDVKGSRVKELAGSSEKIAGKTITLSLSLELQQFAEELLAACEGEKAEGRTKLDEQWMRGGAIVAMIPQTGEVVALASYPRFDPNDFIRTRDKKQKQIQDKNVRKWLENEAYIGEIWDGKRPLTREFFSFAEGLYKEESLPLSWPLFLETILPPKSPIKMVLTTGNTVEEALSFQREGITSSALNPIRLESDKKLALDLYHLLIHPSLFPQELVSFVGKETLETYFSFRQAAMRLEAKSKQLVQELFHELDFNPWRKEHFKDYLKEKRAEEKRKKRHTRPYTDYLDKIEKTLFQAFWKSYRSQLLYTAITGKALTQENRLTPYLVELRELHTSLAPQEEPLAHRLLTLPPEIALSYLHSMRSFTDLKEPLLSREKKRELEKHLASSFYPMNGYGYLRSQAYRQAHAQGSVFKLVTAYQALWEQYQKREKNPRLSLNPLILIDDLVGDKRTNSPTQQLGSTLEGRPIFRLYKGGKLPRSSRSGMGRIDIAGALEQSSNLYFAMLASDHISDPLNLIQAAKNFNLGEKTGIDLPGEAKGNLPQDITHNRSGLYSFAIGQHSLSVTPLQTAVMVSTIANRGSVVKPRISCHIEGEERSQKESSSYPFERALSRVGLYFPLFTQAKQNVSEPIHYALPSEVERTLPFPEEVFNLLTHGMYRAVRGERGSARPSVMRNLYHHPNALTDYREIAPNLLTKTGTAQILYKQSVDHESLATMRRHIWFAAIAYPRGKELVYSPKEAEPELVVVVFSKFGEGGRDGGPLAAQMVKKWRSIIRGPANCR